MTALVPMPDLFLDRQERMTHRDLMSLMEYPFFGISRKPSDEVRRYDDGKVSIEVKPGHAGLATIWDKDILIYVASHLTRCINEGQPVSPKVRFHAHDFFQSCGRSTGGRSYKELIGTLDRLQSTSIRTNIKTGGGKSERGFFSWIKSGRMTERELPNGRKILGMVEVELEDWIFHQIVDDRSILQIAPEYFDLSSGFARRIYELARKHCGQQPRWSINLIRLAEKVGYDEDERKYFKRYLEEVVEANELPEFEIVVSLANDASNTPIASMKGVRGIAGLKATFIRRQGKVSQTRAPLLEAPAAAVINNEVSEVRVAAIKGLAKKVGQTRAKEEPPVIPEADRASKDDFAGAVAALRNRHGLTKRRSAGSS